MIYLKLTIRNLHRQKGTYLIYIITMTILLSIMFFSNYIAVMGKVSGLESASLPVLISVILVFLLHHIDQFMLNQRAKELASDMLFGMDKKKLAWLFVWEYFLYGCFTLVISAGIGALICLIFHRIHPLFLWKKAYLFHAFLQTGGYMLIIEVIAGYWLRKRILDLSIRELMMQKKRVQKSNLVLNRTYWGVGCIGCILVSFIYVITHASWMISWISIVIIAGVYSFYQWFFHWLIQQRAAGSDTLYEGNRLYLLAQVTTNSRQAVIMNTIFSLCLCFSMTCFLFGFLLLSNDTMDQWMGMLQIMMSMIFLVLYLSMISLQMLIQCKENQKKETLLSWLGKDARQCHQLKSRQILFHLLLPMIPCLLYQIIAIQLLYDQYSQDIQGPLYVMLWGMAIGYQVMFAGGYLLYYQLILHTTLRNC